MSFEFEKPPMQTYSLQKQEELRRKEEYREMLRKSITGFSRSYQKAVLSDAPMKFDEAKRLALNIIANYIHSDDLITLLEENSRLKENRDAYEFLRATMYDYFHFGSTQNLDYQDLHHNHQWNNLAAYFDLPELFSYDEDENYIKQLADPNSAFYNLEESKKIQLFWFWINEKVLFVDERCDTYDDYNLRLPTIWFESIRFKMEYNEVTERSLELIDSILRSLFEWSDPRGYLPYVVDTMTKRQLIQVKPRINSIINDFLPDRLELLKTLEPEGFDLKYSLRYAEMGFRAAILEESSLSSLIKAFHEFMEEIPDGRKEYAASLVLSVCRDLFPEKAEEDNKNLLMPFIEYVSTLYKIDKSKLEKEQDIFTLFDIFQDRNGSGYPLIIWNDTVNADGQPMGIYISRLLWFARKMLVNYGVAGLETIYSFSRMDLLSTHLVGLDQGTRMAVRRLMITNQDGEMGKELGGTYLWTPNRIDADKEDSVAYHIERTFRKAIEELHDKGAEITKVCDYYFDTYLSCFISLETFNDFMGNIYGAKWNINHELQNRDAIIITGRLTDLDSLLDERRPRSALEMAWEFMSRRNKHDTCPKIPWEDEEYLYLKEPGIRVNLNVIRIDVINQSELIAKEWQKTRWRLGSIRFQIEGIQFDEEGDIIAKGQYLEWK